MTGRRLAGRLCMVMPVTMGVVHPVHGAIGVSTACPLHHGGLLRPGGWRAHHGRCHRPGDREQHGKQQQKDKAEVLHEVEIIAGRPRASSISR